MLGGIGGRRRRGRQRMLWAVVLHTEGFRQHPWSLPARYQEHPTPQVWQVHVSLDTDKHVPMTVKKPPQLKWKIGLGISRSWIGQAIRWQSQGLQCRAEESIFEPLSQWAIEGLEMLNRLIWYHYNTLCWKKVLIVWDIVWGFGRNILKHFP